MDQQTPTPYPSATPRGMSVEFINDRTSPPIYTDRPEAVLQKSSIDNLRMEEFQAWYFARRFATEPKKRRKSCTLATIKAAHRAIISANAGEAGEWSRNAHLFYRAFVSAALSPGYAKKVLNIINAWGLFLSPAYQLIPKPVGSHSKAVAEAFTKKADTHVSDELNADLLKKAKGVLKGGQANWLALSYYFGLRPAEVDALRTSRVEQIGDARVLWVYQSKLTGLPENKRWKALPILLPEQEALLSVIREGSFSRPVPATLHKHLGPRIHLYAGRKGFARLLLARGFTLDHVKFYLGHTSIETTRAYYVEKMHLQVADIVAVMKNNANETKKALTTLPAHDTL